MERCLASTATHYKRVGAIPHYEVREKIVVAMLAQLFQGIFYRSSLQLMVNLSKRWFLHLIEMVALCHRRVAGSTFGLIPVRASLQHVQRLLRRRLRTAAVSAANGGVGRRQQWQQRWLRGRAFGTSRSTGSAQAVPALCASAAGGASRALRRLPGMHRAPVALN